MNGFFDRLIDLGDDLRVSPVLAAWALVLASVRGAVGEILGAADCEHAA